MPDNAPSDLIQELAAKTAPAARKALLRSNPSLGHPSAVKGLCDLAIRLLQVDLDKAEATATSATWLAQQLDDPHSVALSTRALGNVFLLRGATARALQLYEEATTIFENLADPEQVANTHLNQITALLHKGDISEALQLADQAREIFENLDFQLGLARLENNLGTLYHRQQNHEKARLHWQEAYERFLDLDKSHDAAIALRNLAVAEISANNYHAALSLYRKARAYCAEQGLTILIHEIDYNIAYLYFLRGDYERALLGYQEARARSQELEDVYHSALCDLDESELYLELNLLRDASELADRAIASFSHLQRRHERAKALALRGIAASRLGESPTALDYLRTSRSEFESEHNLAWASLIFLYEALVFRHEGRLFEARRAATSALAGFEELGAGVKISLCNLVLAQLAVAESSFSLARAHCDRASQLLEATDLPPLQFQVLFTLGEIHEASGRFEDALTAYEAAEELLDSMRSRVSTEEIRLPLITDRLQIYERLLHLRLDLSSITPTAFQELFRTVEKSKARSFSDLLASRARPISTATPARSSLVEQVRTLREELNWYYKRLVQTDYASTPPTTKALQRLRASLAETERKLARSLSQVSKADFELGSLHEALTVGFTDVQSLLADGELVLQYFVGRDAIFLLSFSQDSADCEAIAVPNEISELRRLVDFQLSRLSNAPAVRGTMQTSQMTLRHLERLYAELIGPVAKSLKEFSRLTVIPHSFLFYLSFGAFESGRGPLSDQINVTYAPSASSLFFCRKSLPRSGTAALLFETTQEEHRYSPLHYLDAHWRTEIVSVESSSAHWRQKLEEEWALIHLPLRTSFRQDNPVLSSIQICAERQTVLDLFSLPLKSSIVVATECGHLPGHSGNGDEIVALTRSLLFAGPKTLVLPLWRTRPQPEQLFLDSFYEALCVDSEVSRALETARRKTRSEYPHPGDWAAWVSFGA